MEKSMTCIKYLMFFFNFIFWLSGLALIIVGGIILGNYGSYFSYADSKFASAPVFIIVVGSIVLVIGFLGCCGAIKENYCMVTTFAVLLAIIFLLEIVAGALGFAYKKKVQEKVGKALDRGIKNYFNSDEPGAKELIDWAQQKFECCGKNSSSDYDKIPASNQTTNQTKCSDGGVSSCYPGNDCDDGDIYTTGCQESFIKFVKDHLAYVGAVAIGIAFIQLIGIIFACCLMKGIKEEYEVV